MNKHFQLSTNLLLTLLVGLLLIIGQSCAASSLGFSFSSAHGAEISSASRSTGDTKPGVVGPQRGVLCLGGASTGNPPLGELASKTYAVTFSEGGLPSGTLWEIGLQSSPESYVSYQNSTSASITVQLANGTYTIEAYAQLANYSASGNGDSVTINGAGLSWPVPFVPGYSLVFRGSGLPATVPWMVTVRNSTAQLAQASLLSTISFLLSPGTYNFTVSASGYSGYPGNGTVNLSATQIVSVTFLIPKVYPGILSGLVNIGSATLYLNGFSQGILLGGGFTYYVAPGIWTIIVTATGFETYYNATYVASNQTVHYSIGLLADPSPLPPPTRAPPVFSNLGELIVAILVVAIVGLTGGLIIAWRKPPGKSPEASEAPSRRSTATAETSPEESRPPS